MLSGPLQITTATISYLDVQKLYKKAADKLYKKAAVLDRGGMLPLALVYMLDSNV